jgi:hypothetical protein
MRRPGQVTPEARKEQKPPSAPEPPPKASPGQPRVPEIGGPKGPEPTRYGDWEKGGRCTDF